MTIINGMNGATMITGETGNAIICVMPNGLLSLTSRDILHRTHGGTSPTSDASLVVHSKRAVSQSISNKPFA